MTIQDMIERLKDALSLAEAMQVHFSKDGNVVKINKLDRMIVQLEDRISDLEEMTTLASPIHDHEKTKALYNNCIKKLSKLLIERYENLPDPWVLEQDITDQLQSLKIHSQKFEQFTDELFAKSDVKFFIEAVDKQSKLVEKEKQFQCLQYYIPYTKGIFNYLLTHTQIDNHKSYIQEIDEVEAKLRVCELSSDKAYDQISLIQQSIFLAAIKAMKTANSKDAPFINRLNSLESKIKTSNGSSVNYVDVIKLVREHQKPVEGAKSFSMDPPSPLQPKKRAKKALIGNIENSNSSISRNSSDSSESVVRMTAMEEVFDSANNVNSDAINALEIGAVEENLHSETFNKEPDKLVEILEPPKEVPGIDLFTLITAKQTVLNNIKSLDDDLSKKMSTLREMVSQPNIELTMDISAIIPLPLKIKSLIENFELKARDTNIGQEHSNALEDLDLDRLESLFKGKRDVYGELLKIERDVNECLANEVRKIEINRASIVYNNRINKIINNLISKEIRDITTDFNTKLTTIRNQGLSDLDKDLFAMELDKILDRSLKEMKQLFDEAKIKLEAEVTRFEIEDEQRRNKEAKEKEQMERQNQRQASPECRAVQNVIDCLRQEIHNLRHDPSDPRLFLLRNIKNDLQYINNNYIQSDQSQSDFYIEIIKCLADNLKQDKLSKLSPYSALASAFSRFINWALLPLRQLFSKNAYQARFFASETEKAVVKAAQEAMTALTTIQIELKTQLSSDGGSHPLQRQK